MFLIKLLIGFLFFSDPIKSENIWLDPAKIQHTDDSSYYRQKEAQYSSYLRDAKHAELNKAEARIANQLCNQVIFDNNTLKVSEYGVASCLMQIDEELHNHDLGEGDHHRRQKREIFVRTLPFHFTIPSTVPPEPIDQKSYIEMSFHVCSDPGAEVLVFDRNTLKMIFAFRNGGGTYQCNRLQIPQLKYDSSVSDSSQVQVEYRLPKSDYILSDVTYDFLADGTTQGSRVVSYKQAGDQGVIFELEITYNELKFHYYPPEILTLPGIVDSSYEPNMVKTYVIPKKTECSGLKCNLIGIEIEIRELDLDFSKGDYVLIGPGSKPHFWNGSQCQIIARRIDGEKTKKIWVHADSAFIMLVTHNSNRKVFHPKNYALKFSWKEPTTFYEGYDLDESSTFLRKNSIQLCFSGGDCEYWQASLRYDFVEEAVHIFNNYLIEHEKDITTLIGRDSVRLFDFEDITYPNSEHRFKYTEKYCRLNLAISSPFDEAYPLVNGDTVRKMFFGNGNQRSVLHNRITVTDCVFQHISLLSILLPIIIVLSVSGTAIFFFWRIQQNVLQSYIRLRT